MRNIVNTIATSQNVTRFWKDCTSSLQKTSQTKMTTSPIHSVGDAFVSNNLLEVFKRNNPQLPSDVLAKFEELVSSFSARGDKNKTEEAFNKLVNNVFLNKNYTNKQDILKYITRLNNLFKKKTPNGENLLDAEIVRFLADFKNNGLTEEQTRQYAQILKYGGELGYIPRSFLNQLERYKTASGINPSIMEDINKLKYADEHGINSIDVFIPKMKGSIDTAWKERAKVKVGDFMYFEQPDYAGRRLFIKTSEAGYHGMDLSREELFELLPPVNRFLLAQNRIGSCYQLASYTSMLQNPETRAQILRSIYTTSDGKTYIKGLDLGEFYSHFKGKFPDIDKYGTLQVELPNNKFLPTNVEHTVRANSLLQGMELLYGKHRKYSFADKYIEQELRNGRNEAELMQEVMSGMDKYIYEIGSNGKFTRTALEDINKEVLRKNIENNDNRSVFKSVDDYYKKSGYHYEVFEYFNRNSRTAVNHYDIPQNCGIESVHNLLKQTNGKVRNLSTISLPDTATRAEHELNREKYLYSNHSYTLINYDDKKQIVSYINPWNNLFTYEMSLKDLIKNIKGISTFG